MSIQDCLLSAVEQGAISREEASQLNDEFQERFAQAQASLGDDAARAHARKALEEALRATAIEKRRRANLTEAARRRLKGRLQGYRTKAGEANVFEAAMGVLSHYGYRGAESVRGRSEAIVSLAQGKLVDLMWDVRRTAVSGRRLNKPLMADIVRELKGEASGNDLAKGYARSLGDVFEDLRQRFNNAGGAIPKLDRWGLPHDHDALKIKHAGRDAWKADIRGRLDPDAMINPLTKAPVGAAGLDRALDHVYDTIVSDGWANRLPNMIPAGRGALATQRTDPRFLVFKSADDWMAYNAAFGRGDLVQAAFHHINGMAKDIAALEVLGPNPGAMVEWMKQVVRHEIGKRQAGKPSLAGSTVLSRSAGPFAEHRLDSLYQYLRGRPTVISGWAKATGDLKNVLSSALLGSAGILAGVSDPFIAQSARRLAGLPVMKDLGAMLDMVKGQSRKEAVRSGIMWEEYLHLMNDEARVAGIVTGSDWSRFLVDRATMAFGLKPLTTGRKLVEARMWQAHLADEAGKRFDALEPRLKATLEGFGFTAGDWEIMRASVDPNGFITPAEISARGGAVRYIDRKTATPAENLAEDRALTHRLVAEKLAELTASWSERSVPAGTPNIRSLVSANTARGTLPGELLDFGLQFKSFGLSFTSLQLEAMHQVSAMERGGRGAKIAAGGKYIAMMAVPLTLAGAAYMQIKAIADGKDPEDMSPANADFWMRAMITGGGFGLLGDFLNASSDRFGQGIGAFFQGPGLPFLSDLAGLTIGNATEFLRGDETHAGRELVKFMGRYTPILSSHWATRGAYRRMILDQLQWLVDPTADKSFKAQVSRAKSRTGQHYYWPPGQAAPNRAPDLGAIAGQ